MRSTAAARYSPRAARSARRSPRARRSVIENLAHLSEFQPGEVLVTDITTPDWEPVMKTAAAIVTNRGGRTCHAAIIARELGIPAVVGCRRRDHDACPTATRRDGVVRRGRLGARCTAARWPSTSIAPRSATCRGRAPRSCSTSATPISPSRRRSCPTTAWAWRGWSSSSASTSRSIPMALLHPEKVDGSPRRAGRSTG